MYWVDVSSIYPDTQHEVSYLGQGEPQAIMGGAWSLGAPFTTINHIGGFCMHTKGTLDQKVGN